MIFLTRIILFSLSTVMLSHYVPYLYWLLTDVDIRNPFILYSSVEEDFVFFRFDDEGVHYVDRQGNEYTKTQFDAITPMLSYRQLYHENRLPESIHGVEITTQKIREQRVSVQIKPEYIDFPGVALYTILDSGTGSVELETPQDFMRINNSVEFLNARSNTLESEKSDLFKNAFIKADFAFPAKAAYGNPTTRKPYDEGTFIVDSQNKVYQLLQKQGKPILNNLSATGNYSDIWDEINPAYIMVSEQANKELRCVVIDETNQVWLIVGQDFKPVQVPLKKYDPSSMKLKINGNLMHIQATVQSNDYLESVVFDRAYNMVNNYSEDLPTTDGMMQGKFADILFPWTTQFRSNHSAYIDLYTSLGSPFVLIINLLLAIGTMLISIKQGLWDRGRKIMSILILLSGIFGFIAYWFIPTQRPPRV